MAILLAYDSGVGGVPSGEWGHFAVGSGGAALTPVEVAVVAIPLVAPKSSWNTSGWACIDVINQGQRVLGRMTAIALAPELSSTPYTTLDSSGLYRVAGRIDNFRAVRWNLNEWVGNCRILIYYLA